jgi:hypothetical protein
VLKHVQPHEISFSTSVTARISVVKHSTNSKTSCALHVIPKNGAIFFASYIAAAVTEHHKKNNKPVMKGNQPHEIPFNTSIF